jgi:hypothetical protein
MAQLRSLLATAVVLVLLAGCGSNNSYNAANDRLARSYSALLSTHLQECYRKRAQNYSQCIREKRMLRLPYKLGPRELLPLGHEQGELALSIRAPDEFTIRARSASGAVYFYRGRKGQTAERGCRPSPCS